MGSSAGGNDHTPAQFPRERTLQRAPKRKTTAARLGTKGAVGEPRINKDLNFSMGSGDSPELQLVGAILMEVSRELADG